jgi:hypothetical protein
MPGMAPLAFLDARPTLLLRSCAVAALLITAACSDDGSEGTASTATGASGGAGSGGAAGGTGAGAGGTATGLDAFSDPFDGSELDGSWTVFNDAALDATVEDGSLRLTMTEPALWFHAGQGTLLHKSVTGDFKVTATVHATKTSAPAEAPDATIHLGGLMARNPAGDEADGVENYVFIVVGYDENDLSVETKSTVDDSSEYVGPTWPSAEAELRLCRVGSTFSLYKRAIGDAAWTEAMSYERPDLPETLQVGPNAYTLGAPDLTVVVDEVVFAEAPDAAACDSD